MRQLFFAAALLGGTVSLPAMAGPATLGCADNHGNRNFSITFDSEDGSDAAIISGEIPRVDFPSLFNFPGRGDGQYGLSIPDYVARMTGERKQENFVVSVSSPVSTVTIDVVPSDRELDKSQARITCPVPGRSFGLD